MNRPVKSNQLPSSTNSSIFQPNAYMHVISPAQGKGTDGGIIDFIRTVFHSIPNYPFNLLQKHLTLPSKFPLPIFTPSPGLCHSLPKSFSFLQLLSLLLFSPLILLPLRFCFRFSLRGKRLFFLKVLWLALSSLARGMLGARRRWSSFLRCRQHGLSGGMEFLGGGFGMSF